MNILPSSLPEQPTPSSAGLPPEHDQPVSQAAVSATQATPEAATRAAGERAVALAGLALLARLRRAWQARSQRERHLVAGAGALIAVALLVSLADWLRSERSRLDRSLPRMQAQMAQVEQAASEIADLRTQPTLARPASIPAQLAVVDAAARSRGLTLTVQPVADGLRVSGSAGFDALLEWLASLQREQGLRVQRALIERTGNDASVDITLVGGG